MGDDRPLAGAEPRQPDRGSRADAIGDAVPTTPPQQLRSARVALFVNAVLITLEAVRAYLTSLAESGDAARALGVATFTGLFAVFCVVLGVRLDRGGRRTRMWTNVLATLTLLLPGLGRAGQGDPLGLLVAVASLTVLILVNTAAVRRFFQQSGNAREPSPPHPG